MVPGQSLKNLDPVKAWKIFNHKARSFDIWYVTKIVQIMPLGKLISQVSDLGPSWPSCLQEELNNKMEGCKKLVAKITKFCCLCMVWLPNI